MTSATMKTARCLWCGNDRKVESLSAEPDFCPHCDRSGAAYPQHLPDDWRPINARGGGLLADRYMESPGE